MYYPALVTREGSYNSSSLRPREQAIMYVVCVCDTRAQTFPRPPSTRLPSSIPSHPTAAHHTCWPLFYDISRSDNELHGEPLGSPSDVTYYDGLGPLCLVTVSELSAISSLLGQLSLASLLSR